MFFDECAKAIADIPLSEYDRYASAYESSDDVILLGNGGSNSAASHIAQDMVKRGGKRAISFTDPSMLTCFINDYGQEFAFSRFIENYRTENTLVILISSSGNSKNLLNCVRLCENDKMAYGVLTAFDSHNMIRSSAKNAAFDYHIKTHSYGVAECVHQIFLHGIVECSE